MAGGPASRVPAGMYRPGRRPASSLALPRGREGRSVSRKGLCVSRAARALLSGLRIHNGPPSNPGAARAWRPHARSQISRPVFSDTRTPHLYPGCEASLPSSPLLASRLPQELRDQRTRIVFNAPLAQALGIPRRTPHLYLPPNSLPDTSTPKGSRGGGSPGFPQGHRQSQETPQGHCPAPLPPVHVTSQSHNRWG